MIKPLEGLSLYAGDLLMIDLGVPKKNTLLILSNINLIQRVKGRYAIPSLKGIRYLSLETMTIGEIGWISLTDRVYRDGTLIFPLGTEAVDDTQDSAIT